MLVRIGTRNSPMALVQAEQVRDLLEAQGAKVEIVGMTTTADAWKGSLAQLGGKGNFTKEIDEALVAGRVDVAVHCIKDVPGDVPLPAGTRFGAYLPRDDVRDALVSNIAGSLAELPRGARVGTSSVRRRAQLLRARPDLEVVSARGNVNSRLARLDAGELDALLLARAGLLRLGMPERVGEVFAPTSSAQPGDENAVMLPAVGAGALGLQLREGDAELAQLVASLGCDETARSVGAERAMLSALRGHCNSPIAGYAELRGARVSLVGAVFDADGARWVEARAEGSDPSAVGEGVARELLAQGAEELIAATRLAEKAL